MFDIKHKKNHLFLIKTFQIARKNLRGDADITPLRVTARRREKYYTKQFSKLGRSEFMMNVITYPCWDLS